MQNQVDFAPRPIACLVGLPTTVVTKAEPCDIWRVRGPPAELVPEDLDYGEPELYPEAVDEVYPDDDMRGFFDDEPVLPQVA